jgi:hypothetical protein
MATIREYFDTDLTDMTINREWSLTDDCGNSKPNVIAKIVLDFTANARFWAFFVPHGHDVGSIVALIAQPETKKCTASNDGDGVLVTMGHSDYSEAMNSEPLVFTGRIFVYLDDLLEVPVRGQLREYAVANGYQLVIRDREYAMKRAASEKPLAFISHDSRDKDSLVRGLALELTKLRCPVWYDEYSLRVGDSLRASIEKGLIEAKKCILVLSPHFLSNEGWGKAEYDSIFTRELLEKKNVILPIWHGVEKGDVYKYSPRLADRVALSSTLSVEELAGKLSQVILAA